MKSYTTLRSRWARCAGSDQSQDSAMTWDVAAAGTLSRDPAQVFDVQVRGDRG